MDVKFKSVEELLELAQDRMGWSQSVRVLLPGTEQCKHNREKIPLIHQQLEEQMEEERKKGEMS
jgi:hypothetical protein